MGLEGPFEGVKHRDVADLRMESVPEGGGCHTEGSVPKGLQVGTDGGEQARVGRPQVPGWGMWAEEVR